MCLVPHAGAWRGYKEEAGMGSTKASWTELKEGASKIEYGLKEGGEGGKWKITKEGKTKE